MELLLNGLWLFVALLVIALACTTSDVKAAHARHRRRSSTFLAAAFVALVLFPVISVSDDLIAARVEVQEAWTATKKGASLIAAPAAEREAMLPASLPAHRPYWFVVSAITSETLLNPQSCIPPQIIGRAPPVLFL